MLNSTEQESSTDHKKLKYRQIKKCVAFSISGVVFIMLINVKMQTFVGILTFMSRIHFELEELCLKKSYITSGPYLSQESI